MKFWLIAIFCACFTNSFAQLSKAVGFANSYTLTAAEGFPGFNYNNSFSYTPSGKIYTIDYVGNLYIIGNNYYKTLDVFKSLSRDQDISPISNNQVRFNNGTNFHILLDDSILNKVILPPNSAPEYSYFNPILNRMFSFHFTSSEVRIYEFRKDNWQLMNKHPWILTTEEKVSGYNVLNKNMEITTDLLNGNKNLYKLDTIHYTLNFDKSISSKDKEKYHYEYHFIVEGNKQLENSFKNYLLKKGKNKKEVESFIATAVKGNWGNLRYYNDSSFTFSDYDGL